MSIDVVSPLRQRMIEDMTARKLGAGTQRLHISSCKRFAAFLQRSPDTVTVEDIRRFQLHLAETGTSICNRNRIMTGVRFLFRVTLRRLDLAAEIYHLREPQKIPQVLSPDETRRLLAVASSLKARVMLSLSYGCGLRVGEVVRLKVKHIDSAQKIIRIEQSKGRKDRNVMLSPEMLDLLRQWWKARVAFDSKTPIQERWLFPGRRPGQPMTRRQLSRLFHEAANDAGIKKSVTLHALRHSFANRRLIASNDKGVTFKWKDYRVEGPARYKMMTLATGEFIRRFLMHVLPAGFHRIRYYGLLASGKRAENIARARELLTPPMIPIDAIKAISGNASEQTAEPQAERHPCPCGGGPMIIIERFERGCQPKHQPSPVPAAIRIDTS